MDIFVTVVTFIVMFLLVTAVALGMVAITAFAGQHLFNYIMVNTGHPQNQVTFWVACAAVLLLGLIGSFFRNSNSKASK